MNAAERDAALRTPYDPALLDAARQVVWWMPPEETLRNETLFLNQAMRFGTLDVVGTIRAHYTDDTLRQALRDARPGIFDRWAKAFRNCGLTMDWATACISRSRPTQSSSCWLAETSARKATTSRRRCASHETCRCRS